MLTSLCYFKAANPSVVEAKFVQNNLAVGENIGTFTVPVSRHRNIFITSVLQ